MKKTVRALSLILCIIMLFTALTGCKSLDTRRKNQAFWGTKDHSEILLGGKTYKRLQNSDYFAPDVKSQDGMYVSDKDVPVLLASSAALGTRYCIDSKKEVIEVYNDWYAREDVYDKYYKLISEYKLDRLATYIETIDKDRQYHNTIAPISDEDAEIIKAALSSATEEKNPDDDYADIYLDIYETDESLLFQKFNCSMFLYHTSKKVQFLKEDRYYSVKEEYREPLAKVMQKYASDDIKFKQ